MLFMSGSSPLSTFPHFLVGRHLLGHHLRGGVPKPLQWDTTSEVVSHCLYYSKNPSPATEKLVQAAIELASA